MKKKARDSNLQDSMEKEENKMRLQQFMAHCGVASRRACEQYILDGRVVVNGNVVQELGVKVSLTDEVLVDGKKIFLEENKRYVLLNKPEGYVCSLSDEKERQVAVDLIKNKYSERLYNVGRLDMYSQGAIIFTNDGNFAQKLSHPSAELEKEYIVETTRPLPSSLAADFMKGIRIDNVFYRCKKAVELNSHKICIILIEGKNREIRKVFESRDVGIKSLTRVRIGCVGLGNLKPGESRDLSGAEVNALLKLCHNKEY